MQQVDDRYSAPEVLLWNPKGHYHCHNLPLAGSWTISAPQPIALRLFDVSFIQTSIMDLPLLQEKSYTEHLTMCVIMRQLHNFQMVN